VCVCDCDCDCDCDCEETYLKRKTQGILGERENRVLSINKEVEFDVVFVGCFFLDWMGFAL